MTLATPTHEVSRILMAAHPTVGHTSALRAIGGRLMGRGHRVAMSLAAPRVPLPHLWPEPLRVAAGLPSAIGAEGIELLPLRPPLGLLWHGSRIAGKTGYAELAVAVELFTSGIVGQARTLARHAQSWRADVVVADYLMPAAMLGAELAGVPFVAVYHSALPFPVEGEPPFGSGLTTAPRGSAPWLAAERSLSRLAERFESRVASAARVLGVSPGGLDGLTQPLSRDLNILATTPELEPGLAPLRGPVRMTGPCLPRPIPADASHPALRALPSEGARIYVSLGTVFNDQPALFERILEGLARLDMHVVVSAGASYERLRPRRDARTHIFRSVPQVEVLRRVDVVVTHGGNNTVQESLAAGCTLVVIPFGGDQLENARRVARLGAGVSIHPTELTPTSLRDAVNRVSSPPYVARARALATSLEGRDGAEEGASAVLELIERRRRRR